MVQLAVQTLRAFEHSVAADGGNAFRMWLGRVIPHMDDAYRQETDPFRSHMGSSGIGRECARVIWYDFRWAMAKQFSGRMLRLFNRGHLEEARFIALLLSIGCNVIQQDENGRQFRISEYGGHYGGSGDGMFDGCPDLPPGMRALSEFKTHNTKSFAKLAGASWRKHEDFLMGRSKTPVAFDGEGVRGAKFEHYVQMQQYMRKMGLPVAVYFAVNKDTDEVYAEVVPLDVEVADRFLHRAIQIIPMRVPPDKISKTASSMSCKFCDYKAVCHYSAPVAVNCRTCEWSYPVEDGAWQCEHPQRLHNTLSKAVQLTGCKLYSKNSKAF